jgi:hypothetical protein
MTSDFTAALDGARTRARVRSRPTTRTKLFGAGRPRPLDREAKVRVMHRARCLSRSTAWVP